MSKASNQNSRLDTIRANNVSYSSLNTGTDTDVDTVITDTGIENVLELPKLVRGALPKTGGFATFLRLEGSEEGELVPLHEQTQWDIHFKSPLFGSLVYHNDPCDGRDHGANERNFLAWLRLAAGFTSTSFAFIINYYVPPGKSIFGPDKQSSSTQSLENRGSFAWGLIFLASSLGTIFFAYFCYVNHMHHVGRRSLLVQFNWQTLVFFGLTCAAIFGACAYMMVSGFISRNSWPNY
ncbi:hypothetical protein V1514DRAFT_336612 [Lipomyces japonicus]|uniref:uncharacterized protein n=1 Tax=Lipomyces japonicus TaxID=56871 RepID=UPI0034CF9B55